MQKVQIKDFFIGSEQPLLVVSGPCVIESEEGCLRAAEFLKTKLEKFPVHFVFKSSYDKANRSSIDAFRGPGLDEGLRILERVRNEFDVPIFTDVHSPEEARAAGAVCDVIQIPAFLCRQTDLLVAAGETGCVVNVKKGQFMAPWEMSNVIEKIASTGNKNIILTERGVMYGYNNLVSDMRSIPIMQGLGYPVLFDASHSVQLPAGLGTSSGGQREFIPVLARSAIAAGCNGLYIESHPNPSQAKCDATAMLAFDDFIPLISQVVRLYDVLQEELVVSG